MGAHQDGTRAQSASGLKEKVSATDTRKEWPLEGGSRPKGAKEAASLMEECLLDPHCGERHRATACEKFRELSLQHRQSVIAEKELCANCLSSLGRYVFGSELSYNKAPPRLPGLGC
jgi:hypothetical protein